LISKGKGKTLKLRKQFGFYAWNVQSAGNMRSIIPFKAIKVYFEKQFKRKNPKTAIAVGVLCLEYPKRWEHAQHNPF
jgi:hypothetical protein